MANTPQKFILCIHPTNGLGANPYLKLIKKPCNQDLFSTASRAVNVFLLAALRAEALVVKVRAVSFQCPSALHAGLFPLHWNSAP